MYRHSLLNVLMFLLSVAGSVVAFILGEMMLNYIVYLPNWLQCGIYLFFISSICCLVLYISEKIHSGQYAIKHKIGKSRAMAKAVAIFLPLALVVGIATQFLYGLVGTSSYDNPKFQGSMIVCDISSSMLENDPSMDTVEAVLTYVDGVPLGEYLGITMFNHEVFRIREYTPLGSEEERDELKQTINNLMRYDGNTDIQAALLDAMEQIRELEDKDWPGIILLFSDGMSGIDYNELVNASLGNVNNPKNKIPVNTIYYAESSVSGYQMNMIAQKTGGMYHYAGINDEALPLRDVFTHSRSIYKIENPHLIQSYFGEAWKSPFRVLLQILLLTTWGVLIGAMVSVFLNNTNLLKGYLLIKIIISLVGAVVFALIMLLATGDPSFIARMLLTAAFCVMLLPTYRWE